MKPFLMVALSVLATALATPVASAEGYARGQGYPPSQIRGYGEAYGYAEPYPPPESYPLPDPYPVPDPYAPWGPGQGIPGVDAFQPLPRDVGSPPASRSAPAAYPSLYETLSRDPEPASAWPRGGRHESPGTSAAPVPGQKRYRFRGDNPSDESAPGRDSGFQFRPLTAQERERGQATPGWRPLTSTRPEPYPPPLPPSPLPAPGPEAGRAGYGSDGWFDRYYGDGRR